MRVEVADVLAAVVAVLVVPAAEVQAVVVAAMEMAAASAVVRGRCTRLHQPQ